MRPLEYYVDKTEEAVREGMARGKESQNWPELLGELTKKGKYQKVMSLVRIMKELAPEMISDKILKMLPQDDPSRLPFNPDKLEFKGRIGKGGEHKVYLLESTDKSAPSYALKLNFQNLGSLDQIKKKAAEFKKEHEEIKQRYEAIPGIVPKELTIISSDLRRGKPIMATIQKFYGGKIRDLFHDFSREELLELFEREPKLCDEFKQFQKITEKEYNDKGVTIDFPGDKNLSIIETEAGPKLIILDPHNMVSKDSEGERVEAQEKCMRELRNIYEAVSV